MRLINAEKLRGCAIVRPYTYEDIKAIESCNELVEHRSIPTAYDVDKVINELKRNKIEDTKDGLADVYKGFNTGLDKAIEIVKGGIADE